MKKTRSIDAGWEQAENSFLDIVKELGVCLYKKNESRSSYSSVNTKDIDMECGLYCDWISGGVTGGSCWDDGETDNHTSRESDPENEDVEKDLERILEEVCPSLSFLQYKKLLRGSNDKGLIETDDRYENEYYGNSTSYRIKWLPLNKLYAVLKEMNVL